MVGLKESILNSTNTGKKFTLDRIKTWLHSIHLDSVFINDDLTIDIPEGTYSILNFHADLPEYIQFNKCHCEEFSMTHVTTLRGCPKELIGNFIIDDCNLKNLEYSPEFCTRFVLNKSYVDSLEGISKDAGVICLGNNKKHYEKDEVKKYTKCNNIHTIGDYTLSKSEILIGDYDWNYYLLPNILKEFDDYKNKTLAKSFNAYKRYGKMILRFDFTDAIPDIPQNGIYMSFMVDPIDLTTELSGCGHINLTEEDKKGKYRYYALKSFLDPYYAEGGKKFRKQKAKSFTDLAKRIMPYVKEVAEAALRDQGGKLEKK